MGRPSKIPYKSVTKLFKYRMINMDILISKGLIKEMSYALYCTFWSQESIYQNQGNYHTKNCNQKLIKIIMDKQTYTYMVAPLSKIYLTITGITSLNLKVQF